MITPKIINEGLPSETVEWTEKMEEGDVIHGFCCQGYDATVVLAGYTLCWLQCANPGCPKDRDGLYHGITAIDEEGLAWWMIEQKEKQ